MAIERMQHLFDLGALEASLWPRWSAQALMQGWADSHEWTEDERKAFIAGYESVRGQVTEAEERRLDRRQDWLISDFLAWEAQGGGSET